jgi:DNA polymerase IV (archaeal DinB-like DNA polymerase)
MHMDLDSFYASAEELRHPEAKGKPVVICVFSGRTEESGAIATSNYLARKSGIRAGMPISQAKRLAPENTIFFSRDMEYYREISERVMDLLDDECDVIEQASIDEAYMDVTIKSNGLWESAETIAIWIKNKILEREGLTCSIGIGPNKLIAKMASRVKKPDGLTIITETQAGQFIENSKAKDIHGIGTKSLSILESMKIQSAKDLAQANPLELEERLGKNKARLFIEKAKGIDESPVEPRVAKQLSRIGTLKEDTRDIESIIAKLQDLLPELEGRLVKKDVKFKTVSIILINSKHEMQTRSKSISDTSDISAALSIARELLEKYLSEERDVMVRRIGLSVSNLTYSKEQKSLGDF